MFITPPVFPKFQSLGIPLTSSYVTPQAKRFSSISGFAFVEMDPHHDHRICVRLPTTDMFLFEPPEPNESLSRSQPLLADGGPSGLHLIGDSQSSLVFGVGNAEDTVNKPGFVPSRHYVEV
jgi:hypothetical protein